MPRNRSSAERAAERGRCPRPAAVQVKRDCEGIPSSKLCSDLVVRCKLRELADRTQSRRAPLEQPFGKHGDVVGGYGIDLGDQILDLRHPSESEKLARHLIGAAGGAFK